MPHRIRLKKPWTRRDGTGETTRGVDVPDSSEDRDAKPESRVTYCRRFNRPTGIEPTDRLELEIGEVIGTMIAVRLNGLILKADQNVRPDITEHVSDHNELEIEIHSIGSIPRLIGPVNLWIVS